jgi:hypothetical protein
VLFRCFSECCYRYFRFFIYICLMLPLYGCTRVCVDYSIDKYFEENATEQGYYLAYRLTSIKTEIEMDEMRRHYAHSLALAKLQKYDEVQREKRKEEIFSLLNLRDNDATLHYSNLEANIGADAPVYYFRYLTKSNSIESGYVTFVNGSIVYRYVESEEHPAGDSSVGPRRGVGGIEWP